MKDPYEVLGVEKGASMEEIREAYKELVKKYHPDRYQDNPLADLAEEKLQEINEAYDALSKNDPGGGYGGSNSSYDSYSGYSQQSSPELQRARACVNAGDWSGAETILNQSSSREAEWYYLSSMVSYQRGWYDDAFQKIQTAVSMEPNNGEYRMAMTRMTSTGGMYQNTAYGRGYRSNQDVMCQLCGAYMCADCVCDCC